MEIHVHKFIRRAQKGPDQTSLKLKLAMTWKIMMEKEILSIGGVTSIFLPH